MHPLTAILFAFYLAGLFIGFRVGLKRGRDIEWIEQTIARSRADKNRRDSAGRFKAVRSTTPNHELSRATRRL